MSEVQLAPDVSVPAESLRVRFVLASGPGGQNINKVATAVELRFYPDRSKLPEDLLARAKTLAGNRLTGDGEILLFAQSYRTQPQNRRDAYARLADIIRRARYVPRPRKKTKPSRAAVRRRLDGKKHRGDVKRARSKPKMDS